MFKTILIFTYVGLAILILTPFGLLTALLSFIGLRKQMLFFSYCIAQGWARSIMGLIGCKIDVSGRNNIPLKGGVCFVSNHGSIFDILVLLAYAGRPFGFIAKKELIYVPLINMWIAILGGLFIDRKNLRKGYATITAGIKRIKKGGGMVIFPEGRRSRGEGLLEFHAGSLKLATKSDAIIVPVALKGTYEIFEKNKYVAASPVKITFCKPVNTAEISASDKKMVLAEQIHGMIKEALES